MPATVPRVGDCSAVGAVSATHRVDRRKRSGLRPCDAAWDNTTRPPPDRQQEAMLGFRGKKAPGKAPPMHAFPDGPQFPWVRCGGPPEVSNPDSAAAFKSGNGSWADVRENIHQRRSGEPGGHPESSSQSGVEDVDSVPLAEPFDGSLPSCQLNFPSLSDCSILTALMRALRRW